MGRVSAICLKAFLALCVTTLARPRTYAQRPPLTRFRCKAPAYRDSHVWNKFAAAPMAR